MTDLLLALVGLALLLAAGDALVRGAVALSLRLGVPAMIVGLTVVSFGTSAPELLISVQAALRDAPGIALGNVVGSNIANVLLVIGLPALIAPFAAEGDGFRRSYLQMLAASVLLIGLCAMGALGRWQAALLLAGLAAMLFDAWRESRDGGAETLEEIEGAVRMPGWRVAAYLVAGLVGLPLGADLLVDGAVGIARAAGVGEEVIGLTLVAVGTSLPELAATAMAAVRGRADVALGNVVGSNLFNILGILGVAAMVAPIPVAPAFLGRDLWVMLAAALLLGPFLLRGWRIGRPVGFAFLALYGVYLWLLFGSGGGA